MTALLDSQATRVKKRLRRTWKMPSGGGPDQSSPAQSRFSRVRAWSASVEAAFQDTLNSVALLEALPCEQVPRSLSKMSIAISSARTHAETDCEQHLVLTNQALSLSSTWCPAQVKSVLPSCSQRAGGCSVDAISDLCKFFHPEPRRASPSSSIGWIRQLAARPLKLSCPSC